MNQTTKIGAHVSAAGKLKNAVLNAQAIGADCLQIFGASPRSWYAPLPQDSDVRTFKDALKESGLGPVYLHSAYLVNLASPNQDTVRKSIKSLIDHLNIANCIGAAGLIFHIGSGKDMAKNEAIKQIANGIKEVLKKTKGQAKLLMENDAGGGGKVGSKLTDISILFNLVKSDRIAICFDTAHAFESGLIEKYTPKTVAALLTEFDNKIGLKHLHVIHANDSKTKAGSNHDRHENIGKGYIGQAGFKALAGDKRLRDKIWILEVPGFNNKGPDKDNINLLKSIFKIKS